ncbi:MAG: LCP family protein [Firmicutes bacterium]|nr:LCP family protein [Bacillota bacterium]
MATNSGNHKKNAGKNAPQRGTASKGTAPRTNGKKMSAKQRKAKKRKRIILFTVEIVALVVLLAALVSVLMITKMDKVKINPEDIAVNPEVEENTEMKGYRNIALFGVDSRTGKLGKGNRSDTIMIASINQDTGDVKLVSVYRDTYLNLGTDAYNKANAAYAQGGPEQAINMLNMCFDLNIQEYVTVGFDALIETIDALGGIQIDVHENEIEHLNNYQRSMFSEDENDALNENIVKVTKPGLQTLNGLQATAYCRIRYVGDDFGRAERQRKVLLACLDKAKQANPATLVEILNKVLEHVYTNIGVEEMASVLKDVASYEVVAQDGIPFESARKTGTVGKKGSCVIPVDLAENVKMLHEFLFDAADYVPSEQVQQCSQQISSDTGVYKK